MQLYAWRQFTGAGPGCGIFFVISAAFLLFVIGGVAGLLYVGLSPLSGGIDDRSALLLLAVPERPVDHTFWCIYVLELSMPFLAQCVMCFRNAAAQQLERARRSESGRPGLGIPPLCISGRIRLSGVSSQVASMGLASTDNLPRSASAGG